MIISALIFTSAVLHSNLQAAPICCPVMGGPVAKGQAVTEYNGVRFTYCCAGCDTEFAKDPSAAIEKSAKAGKTVGVSMFDPISMKKIDIDKAKGGFSDYKGIRFYFDNADEKAAFDKEPKKYGMMPKKEALYCPVMNSPVKSYDKASGYADYDGVRYYFCCAGCDTKFAAEPAKFAEGAKDKVQKPTTMPGKADKESGGR